MAAGFEKALLAHAGEQDLPMDVNWGKLRLPTYIEADYVCAGSEHFPDSHSQLSAAMDPGAASAAGSSMTKRAPVGTLSSARMIP